MRERTKRKFCDTRGVWLYRNPEHQSDSEEESATKDSWTRKVEAAEPKAKRAKTDGPTKPQGAAKQLTDQQRQKVDKCSAAITKERAALDDVMQYFSGDVAEYLPAASQKKVETVSKLAEMVLAEKAVVAAPEWEGSFVDLYRKMNDAKAQLQTTLKSVKFYAEEAKAALAEGGP